MFWLQPIAWWGLAALAIPLLIHLLVRQQARRLPFPSLKFLRSTRLAALRRRTISDWPLLIVRLLIISLAVAALAAPVVVSVDRQRSWNARVARAVVRAPAIAGADSRLGDEIDRLIDEERADAFVSAAFTPAATVADGLRDAVRWLATQPPASREVVVGGDLRANSLNARDMQIVPPAIGVRFLPVVPAAPGREVGFRAIAEMSDEAPTLHELQLTLADESTQVEYRTRGTIADPPIQVRAASEDQARVDAALRAVLAEGLVLPRQDRRVRIEFDGATSAPGRAVVQPAQQFWMRRVLEQLPDHRGGELEGRLVVSAGIRGSDPRVPAVIASIARAVCREDRRDLEPRVIPAHALATWSRPPGPMPDDVRPGDEGDRRYFWLAALILLAFEQWMRRRRGAAQLETRAPSKQEARVA